MAFYLRYYFNTASLAKKGLRFLRYNLILVFLIP